VLINSAFALMAAGKAQTIREGIELAKRSIDSGAALDKLNKLIEFTQSA
jgi:anthranilate phosphoribosyltransferase